MQNNSTELLAIYFPYFYNEDGPKIPKRILLMFALQNVLYLCWGGVPYFRLINVRWFHSFRYSRLIHVRWFPCLKIEFVLGFTKFPFHVSERYETHIQALLDFIKPIFMFVRSASSQKYNIKMMYSTTFQNKWYLWHTFFEN